MPKQSMIPPKTEDNSIASKSKAKHLEASLAGSDQSEITHLLM